MEDGKRNAGIGEYCGLIHGNCDECRESEIVPGGTKGLLAATAVFRGIRRPRIDAGRDETVYVYVTSPPRTYEYTRKFEAVSSAPKPVNSVFVAYVELRTGLTISDQQITPLNDALAAGIRGTVNYWEWVLASSEEKSLPNDYQKRYSERMW